MSISQVFNCLFVCAGRFSVAKVQNNIFPASPPKYFFHSSPSFFCFILFYSAVREIPHLVCQETSKPPLARPQGRGGCQRRLDCSVDVCGGGKAHGLGTAPRSVPKALGHPSPRYPCYCRCPTYPCCLSCGCPCRRLMLQSLI